MRLIDADELMKIAQKELDEVRQCEDANPSEAYPMLYAMTLISTAPTIEAEPVRHGRWVEMTDSILETYYDCSVCGESFYLVDGAPFDNLYRYCPNCGAHMNAKDGEE